MNISRFQNISSGKRSIKNYILLSFFLVSLFSGIIVSLVFHSVLHHALVEQGAPPYIMEHIEGHFIIASTLIIVTGVTAILAIAFYIAKKITKPLNELTEGAIDIANGRLDRRMGLDGHDELSRLAESFNYMAEHIETSVKDLEAAKEYNDNIVVSVPSILIVLNRQLDILSTNMAFEKISTQFPSLTLTDFITNLTDDIRRNLETGETVNNEITIVPAGTEANLIFASTVSSIGNEEEEAGRTVPRLLLTLTDVTERRKMKELVLQSMRDWEDTFNMIPDMITIHDNDYNIIQANRAAREVLSIDSVDLTFSNKCYKHYHGKDYAPEECPSCNCLKTGLPVTFEIFEPHLDKFIEIRSIPRIDTNSEVIGQIHIGRDISIRKKIEQEHNKLLDAVTKAKLEWEMTFDSAMEHIVIIDKDLLITRCNRSFAEFVNRKPEEILGHYCFEFFPCSNSVAEECKRCMKNSKDLAEKTEVRTPSGGWLYISHRPISDNKGESSRSVIIATDITEIKQTQEELNESRKALKKQVSDLERFYDMAVGREVKMKQLKKEIKRLNRELEQYKQNTNEFINT